MHDYFDRFTTGCARFTGRPMMLALCLGLALAGLAEFVMKDEHLMSGANLAIGVLTLLLLPVLQATQNRDGAALQAKIDELIGIEKRDEDEIERVRVAEGRNAMTAEVPKRAGQPR